MENNDNNNKYKKNEKKQISPIATKSGVAQFIDKKNTNNSDLHKKNAVQHSTLSKDDGFSSENDSN